MYMYFFFKLWTLASRHHNAVIPHPTTEMLCVQGSYLYTQSLGLHVFISKHVANCCMHDCMGVGKNDEGFLQSVVRCTLYTNRNSI